VRETAINLFLILLVALGCGGVSQFLLAREKRVLDEVRTLEKEAKRWESEPCHKELSALGKRSVRLTKSIELQDAPLPILAIYFESPAPYFGLELAVDNTLTWQLGFNSLSEMPDWVAKLQREGLSTKVESSEGGATVFGRLP
jgi:hypothetical protein